MTDVTLPPSSTVASIRDLTSVLPTELLALIFRYLVALHPKDYQEYNPTDPRPLQPLDWIHISHVCRRWRTIALDSPQLWCRLFPKMGSAHEAFIQRSKNAPLLINGSLLKHQVIPADELLPSLLEQRDRIQALHLYDMYVDTLSKLSLGFTGHWPRLTSLDLSCFALVGAEELPKLPNNIFIETPNLQSLRLVGIDFPCGSGSPSLRTLDYSAKPQKYFLLPPRSRADVAGIVGTLSQMPELRTLHLNLMEPATNPTSTSFIEPCFLPHLQDFVLSSDNIAHTSLIWAQLHTSSSPRTIRIHHKKCIGKNADSESHLVSLCERHLVGRPSFPNALRIKTRTNNHGSNERLSLDFYNRRWKKTGVELDTAELAEDRYHFDLRIGLPSRTVFLRTLLPRLPINSITKLTLVLDVNSEWNQDTIRELFLPMRSIDYLRLVGDNATIALKALMLAPSSDQPAANENVLFPTLSMLCCLNITFKHDCDGYTGTNVGSEHDHRAFFRVLESRSRRRGGKLRQVILEGCRGWEEYMDEWKGSGVDVVLK
ncbi:hypothetical protein PENSPDRAFT_734792 [Peniophora sp. CONT]|nr:hypothetical protein PENSPDRAFT_734792 [Peniophora sp. CONT]